MTEHHQCCECIERLRADRDEQGRFLSVVAEFARTTDMSPAEVMAAVGAKADADRLAATVERVEDLVTAHYLDTHMGRAVLAAIEGTDS